MGKHILMTNEQGASMLASTPLPEFDAGEFPAGWSGLGVEDAGIFMFMFNVSAGAAEFPLHASEDEWLAYVVSGSGTLYAGTADMKQTDSIAYQAGDFITFKADTPHGWKNGSEASRILFTKRGG